MIQPIGMTQHSNGLIRGPNGGRSTGQIRQQIRPRWGCDSGRHSSTSFHSSSFFLSFLCLCVAQVSVGCHVTYKEEE